MAKVSTNVSIDSEVKTAAQELFADLGLDLSTAINMFLRQAIHENGIPFMVTRETPNMETLAAMKESEAIIANPEKYQRYSNVNDLMGDLWR